MHRSYRVTFPPADGTMPSMATVEATALGYRELLRVPTYSWLVSALFLSRLANAMSQVAVVIYLLERTGSPAVTGIGAAAQLLPAIATGPLVGAWLDRVPSRTGLVAATQPVRGLLLVTLVAVGELVNPPAAVYILILAGLGLTFPLPNPGFRALIPLLVPRPLWVRANAVDSIAYDASFVIGPALAAAVVTGVGAPFAIVLQAAATFAAALAARRVREPAGRPLSTEPAFQAAWIGLRAVWTHVELRATMVLMFVSGIGFGVFTIGLPLWARDQLGHSAGASGWMWTAISAGSIIGGLTYGARRPAGSDSRHVVTFIALAGLPLLLVPFAPSLAVGMACMFAAGLFTAPAIISMFAIRQTAVPPELHGRTFAITVSVNVAGSPVGAALAGLLVGSLGVHAILFAAGAAQLAAAGLAALMLARSPRVALAAD
jgi:MFS family permease